MHCLQKINKSQQHGEAASQSPFRASTLSGGGLLKASAAYTSSIACNLNERLLALACVKNRAESEEPADARDPKTEDCTDLRKVSRKTGSRNHLGQHAGSHQDSLILNLAEMPSKRRGASLPCSRQRRVGSSRAGMSVALDSWTSHGPAITGNATRAINTVHMSCHNKNPGGQEFQRMDACFLHAAQALKLRAENVLVLKSDRGDFSGCKAAYTATIGDLAAQKRLEAESAVLRQAATGMLAVC